MKKIINAQTGEIKEEELTADELAERENTIASEETERQQMIADKEAKDNLKSSAKAKLIAGEKLTEEEANILVGV